MSVELSSPVGLIAGNGRFPLEFALNARERGLSVTAVAIQGETEPALAEAVDSLTWIRLGQISQVIRVFKRAGVKQASFAGGVSKIRLLSGVRLDLRALIVLLRARSVKDDVILRALAAELERSGIAVFGSSDLLDESLARKGLLTGRDLSRQERKDAKLGWEAAKGIGALDIGQTAVVRGGMVLAAEAIEGTDAAILRSGTLIQRGSREGRGRGSVVVKVAKPQQDLRFDMPTVGCNTLAAMAAGGASALVLETERAIILEPQDFVSRADELAIAVRVISGPEEL